MGIQAVTKACGRMGERLKTDKRPQREFVCVRRSLEGREGGDEQCATMILLALWST